MKVCICGSRNFVDYKVLEDSLKGLDWKIDVIVSGGARGADRLGEMFGKKNGIVLEVYLAQWEVFGRSAGMIRNKVMCDVSDKVVCFWDGKSVGSKNMIDLCRRRGKEVVVVRV